MISFCIHELRCSGLGYSGVEIASNQHSVQQVQDLSDVERLGKVLGCSRRQKPFNLPWRGVGTDHHDRYGPCAWIIKQSPQYFVSMYVGKVQVQKNEIRLMVLDQLQT